MEFLDKKPRSVKRLICEVNPITEAGVVLSISIYDSSFVKKLLIGTLKASEIRPRLSTLGWCVPISHEFTCCRTTPPPTFRANAVWLSPRDSRSLVMDSFEKRVMNEIIFCVEYSVKEIIRL